MDSDVRPTIPVPCDPRAAYREAKARNGISRAGSKTRQPEGCERPTVPAPVCVIAPKRVRSRRMRELTVDEEMSRTETKAWSRSSGVSHDQP
jgi:hypothetical protein